MPREELPAEEAGTLRHLDFASLRLFEAVAETGSLSAACARLYVALAAEGLRRMVLESRGAADGVRGPLRRAARSSAVVRFLSAALSGFLPRHPHLRLDLRETISRDAGAALRDGSVDLALMALLHVPAGCEHQPRQEDRLPAVVPPATRCWPAARSACPLPRCSAMTSSGSIPARRCWSAPASAPPCCRRARAAARGARSPAGGARRSLGAAAPRPGGAAPAPRCRAASSTISMAGPRRCRGSVATWSGPA